MSTQPAKNDRKAAIEDGDLSLRIADLSGLGPALDALPFCLRVLAENALRHGEAADVAALLAWAGTGHSEAEIGFRPGRILMHDTTSVPALVDIVAMRDIVAENGGDPRKLTPVIPVDAVIDHSLAVERYAEAGAMQANMEIEIARNRERYAFLKWAGATLDNFRIFPPGTGILHTINLEHLATVVARTEIGGAAWAVPDTLIGTDSHTPMINALGVLAWGVGGLEAESAMFGLPVPLAIPDVVGVRLTGQPQPTVSATDLALAVTELLRKQSVVGCFVEFFGNAVPALGVGTRAAIANMAPEYGATTGYFPVDDQTLRYLRETGRSPEAIRFVEAYARRQHLWNDGMASPRYTRIVELDVSTIGLSLAGPRRPQDRVGTNAVPALLQKAANNASLAARGLPENPVAIAAITSCTNTADPRLLVAAGLLARKARQRGLKPPAWVKPSFAPGSGVALRYLERAGLLADLAALGFDVVGIGCTTCIGNSGAFAPAMDAALDRGAGSPVAILSGNRNFPGRIHPKIEDAFLASPPLVVAYAIAGHANLDIGRDPIAHDPNGKPVHLLELWPSAAEIDETLRRALDPGDAPASFADIGGSDAWRAIEAIKAPHFPWDPASTYLRRPPFARLREDAALPRALDLTPLAVFGDDVTTDHISPAGAIPARSAAAEYLAQAGCAMRDFNVYAARRGNFEVMERGLLTNRNLKNRLCPDEPGSLTRHAGTGDLVSYREAARRYAAEGRPLAILAGERYGTGSSRDWAAKGPALLGVAAILAVSFERIHRSNLIGMGILPLALPATWHPDRMAYAATDRIHLTLPDELTPNAKVALTRVSASGERQSTTARLCCETRHELGILAAGGLIPLLLQRALGPPAQERSPEHP